MWHAKPELSEHLERMLDSRTGHAYNLLHSCMNVPLKQCHNFVIIIIHVNCFLSMQMVSHISIDICVTKMVVIFL